MGLTTLFIKGLPWETTAADLEKMFGACGKVVSAKVLTERDTGRSRGMGFVEMGSDEAAQMALRKLDGATIGSRWISVTVARPKEDAPAREPSRRHPEGIPPGGVERRSGRDRRQGWGPVGERREGSFERKPFERKPWDRKPGFGPKKFGDKKPWDKKSGFGPKKFGDKKPWDKKPGFGGKPDFGGKPRFGGPRRPRTPRPH